MRLYRAAEMRDLDRRAAVEFGLPGLELMERAGVAVAETVRKRYAGGEILCMCGKGNNGGDGLVAARHLLGWGFPVRVAVMAPPEEYGGDARRNLEAAAASGVAWEAWSPTKAGDPQLVVDALLGTGIASSPSEEYAAAIRWMNGLGAPVVAVDLPSGLNADTGFAPGECTRAVETVTLGGIKLGLVTGEGPALAGALSLTTLGMPAELLASGRPVATWMEPRRAETLWPARSRSDHKANWGRLLLVGGCRGMAGAMILAARAALRSGAGLVVAAVPESIAATVAGAVPEAMTLALPETRDGRLNAAAAAALADRLVWATAAAVGPGLGRDTDTVQFLSELVSRLTFLALPCVLDADALNILALDGVPCPEGCVLTPHTVELARLQALEPAAVQADRPGSVQAAAEHWGCVIALKGPGTVVADPGGTLTVNSTGGPALATGGTGDVLTGITGACLARALAPVDAAVAAVYLHGLAGDVTGAEKGAPGAIAGDVVDAIPTALRRLRTGESRLPLEVLQVFGFGADAGRDARREVFG